MSVNVHGLRNGLPLCGFTTDVPRDWPPEHKWSSEVDEINCAGCLRSIKTGGDPLQTPVDQITDRVIGALLKHEIQASAEVVNDLVSALLDAPIYSDFVLAVKHEAIHQGKRWGTEHDADKTDEDWFWLLGYLGGKVLRDDDLNKKLHRIIATAAACANWHAQLMGGSNMWPGIAQPGAIDDATRKTIRKRIENWHKMNHEDAEIRVGDVLYVVEREIERYSQNKFATADLPEDGLGVSAGFEVTDWHHAACGVNSETRLGVKGGVLTTYSGATIGVTWLRPRGTQP